MVGSASVSLLVARLLGYQLATTLVIGAVAILSVPVLALVPALDAIERWRHERRGLYWIAQVIIFAVTGLAMLLAGELLVR